MTCERGRRADITHGISAVDWWFTNSRTCLLWILSRSSPDSATESKTVQPLIIFKWFNPWLFLHDTDWKQNSSTHDYFHMIQPMIIFTWYRLKAKQFNPWLFSHDSTHEYFHMIQPMIIFTWYRLKAKKFNPWLFSHDSTLDYFHMVQIVLKAYMLFYERFHTLHIQVTYCLRWYQV